MDFKFLKYTIGLCIPALTFFSLHSESWYTWSTIVFAYALVPLLEFFFKSDSSNLTDMAEALAKEGKRYDWMIYAIVPIQIVLLFTFLTQIQSDTLSTAEVIGKTSAMGVCCGVLGINIGHELGHRVKKSERGLAKVLLMTSLYMHFYIEHNRGHHKNVSTPEDPSSARKGEMVYFFWFRSIVFTYLSAWKIEYDRLKSKGIAGFSLRNEMLVFQLIQLVFLVAIYLIFGFRPLGFFLIAALIGILQLETVNYIEHYGLLREKKKNGLYERVKPNHSWNSNHILGRLILFELSRHSDHHFMASRKYQVLRHHDHSPQMPTGYPGMMLASLVPPLWFWVMNGRLDEISAKTSLA